MLDKSFQNPAVGQSSSNDMLWLLWCMANVALGTWIWLHVHEKPIITILNVPALPSRSEGP